MNSNRYLLFARTKTNIGLCKISKKELEQMLRKLLDTSVLMEHQISRMLSTLRLIKHSFCSHTYNILVALVVVRLLDTDEEL